MSESWRIVKMSGAGNDFVVLGPEEIGRLGADASDWTRRVCRRGLSVGADGVLLVEPLANGSVRMRFLNPDGAEAFCGNGCRCAARFAVLRGYAESALTLETAVGRVPAEVLGERVSVAIPPPEDLGDRRVTVRGRHFVGRLVRAGVPHFVLRVRSVASAPLGTWGPELRRHEGFGSEGVNVDLVEIRPDSISLRTWERGVEGETLACGSGAIAAAWVHGSPEIGGGPVTVVPASGIPLRVEFRGSGGVPDRAVLTGDARVVFEGTLTADGVSGWTP